MGEKIQNELGLKPQTEMSGADIGLQKCTDLDRKLVIPMFVASLTFLVGLSALLHLTDGDLFSVLAQRILVALGGLYLIINAEVIFHWRAGGIGLKRHWWYILFPVLRLCPRDHVDGRHIWIPGLGWRETTDTLEEFLTRVFGAPMIIIALLVLPVVGIEFFYADAIAASTWGWHVINSCSGFIWMAFVFEFVIMFSIVKNRVRYCKKNWIDVAVIMLPLVSFMGAARLGRLLKLKQLTRTAKIYRIRGLTLRAWRAVVALDVIDSILRRDPDTRMESLRIQIKERELEISGLRKRLLELESEHGPKQDHEIPKPKGMLRDQTEQDSDDSGGTGHGKPFLDSPLLTRI